MSQKLDWSLIIPTIYLSEVAFMDNIGYKSLSENMTGDSLWGVLEKNIDEYKNKEDKDLLKLVTEDFTVIDFIANHDSSGLNAILFYRKSDENYYLAIDGVHLTLEQELFHDVNTVQNYPTRFRDLEVSREQLDELVEFVEEKLPEGKQLILTGQSLGGANATALALLLGDKVKLVVAYGAPNPTGWATLSDGNFIKVSNAPRGKPPSRYVTLADQGFTPKGVEIILTDADTSPIFQIIVAGDPFAGRVFFDDAVTKGINLGTVIQVDPDVLEDMSGPTRHWLGTIRGVTEDARYFSQESGFTENANVTIMSGDDRLRSIIDTGNIESLTISTYSKSGDHKNLFYVSSDSESDIGDADPFEAFLQDYRSGNVALPDNLEDHTSIRGVVEEYFANSSGLVVHNLDDFVSVPDELSLQSPEEMEHQRYKEAREMVEAAYPNWHFDWISDEQVVVTWPGKSVRSVPLSYDKEAGRFWRTDVGMKKDAPEKGEDRGQVPGKPGQALKSAIDNAGFDVSAAAMQHLERMQEARREEAFPPTDRPHMPQGRLLLTSAQRFLERRGAMWIPFQKKRLPTRAERHDEAGAFYGEKMRHAKSEGERRRVREEFVASHLAIDADQDQRDRETAWAQATKSDPEIGGQNLKHSLMFARYALDHFGDVELYDFLDDTGLGNHPDVIRMFKRVGEAAEGDRTSRPMPYRKPGWENRKRPKTVQWLGMRFHR